MQHATEVQEMRSYRAFVYPRNVNVWDLEGEGGKDLLHTYHLKAASSEDATQKASWVTGMAVRNVERKD